MIKIKKIDLTGERFGKLTVIEKGSGYISPSGSKSTTWICKCDCGNTTVVRASSLKSGDTKSCRCLSKNVHSKVAFKHGFGNKDRIYRIWSGIKTRCFNDNMKYWKHYGGRGITVCSDWLGESGFENFYKWAINNGYSDELTIDRIDPNGNYEPENCRWATYRQQEINRRNTRYLTLNGTTKCVSEWCETLPINQYTIYWWYKKFGREYAEERIEKELNIGSAKIKPYRPERSYNHDGE